MSSTFGFYLPKMQRGTQLGISGFSQTSVPVWIILNRIVHLGYIEVRCILFFFGTFVLAASYTICSPLLALCFGFERWNLFPNAKQNKKPSSSFKVALSVLVFILPIYNYSNSIYLVKSNNHLYKNKSSRPIIASNTAAQRIFAIILLYWICSWKLFSVFYTLNYMFLFALFFCHNSAL